MSNETRMHSACGAAPPLLRPKEGRTDDEAVVIDSRIGQGPLPEIADLHSEVASDGVSDAEAEKEVLLPVVLVFSIDGRFPAYAVGETTGDPYGGAEVVDDVPLDREEGILFELLAAKKSSLSV